MSGEHRVHVARRYPVQGRLIHPSANANPTRQASVRDARRTQSIALGPSPWRASVRVSQRGNFLSSGSSRSRRCARAVASHIAMSGGDRTVSALENVEEVEKYDD